MAFNDGFYRYKNVLKKQLKLASRIYLSIAIVLAPIFLMSSANASTLAGGSGWRVASTVANGVGVTVNGVKDVMVNGAKKTVTGVANVTPTASQVGKFMGKNLGTAAVVGAVDLLLDGVDWVIDEGGKVTKKPSAESLLCSANLQTCYEMAGGLKRGTPEAVCSVFNKKNGTVYHSATASTCYYSYNGKKAFLSSIYKINNPNYDSSAPAIPNETVNDKEGKPLTLTSLGQMVIDQAQEEVRTGNPAVPIATPVTQAAATAVVGEAATDETQARPISSELDKSAAIPTDQTAVGEIAPPTTNPDTGEVNPGSISLDFPVFCSWAPSMCVLADKVQEAITDARDWATSEPQEKEPENIDFEDLELDASDVNLTATGSCPQDSVSFSVMGKSVTLDMPYQPVCDALNFFKPAVLLVGAVASVYIVAGVRTKEEDQT
ncbi:virulence factor TspB C-terminal domain-related protein [Acinetobacter johnsonii]|uniref:virulence factor TspB C-terminal domain-related protein n=1 Tax=Acinetobacter johnsonii TaxID=40214 RepID=UPI00244B4C4A|nr:virulence factor TspB C-terminal domain-related protein [Acinetobacter johnsonii]MDH1407705.1 virulence factor TspB C-terminal domain-related protein [Acinetobacter johnsonii]